MNANHDFERQIADYYGTVAPTRAPDWLLTRALDTIDTTPQRRTALGRIWRVPTMTSVAKLAAGAVAIVAIAAVGLTVVKQPAVGPATELGIFAPVAGRIVYVNDGTDLGYGPGLWAVDPSGPTDTAAGPSVAADVASTLVRLDVEEATPLGWSSDGTELLIMRTDGDPLFPKQYLSIIHADGSEIRLNDDPMYFGGAAISPDGSRVVFAAQAVPADELGLYVIDAEGGQPARLPLPEVKGIVMAPTFSPNGTQIAYVDSGQSENHVWVIDADGGNAREILANEVTRVGGVGDLQWSPAGDRIAGVARSGEGTNAIYTFTPDGSDLTKVISGGMRPYWSPDGSQIAYTIECSLSDTSCGGFAIANADGSDVREFGFGASGPWHPRTVEERAKAPASPSPSTSRAPPPPSASPRPSPSPGFSRFTSTIHGISIDYPSGWQARPATEPWSGGELSFDSPAADVIFDPAIGDSVYMLLASQPYGGLSEDGWRDKNLDWLCDGIGGSFGSWKVAGAGAFVRGCGSIQSANIFTDTRGYLVALVTSDEPALVELYGWDWLKSVLETVDLRPEEAPDASSPSESP